MTTIHNPVHTQGALAVTGILFLSRIGYGFGYRVELTVDLIIKAQSVPVAAV